MPTWAFVLLLAAGALALAAWLAVLVHPARARDMRPCAEDERSAPAPGHWPAVAVVVPAHDEVSVLPDTVPTLLAQDYAGPWHVVLVDDRSGDGTAALARALANAAPGGGRLDVVTGAALPAGWVGKVWAMSQGVEAALGARADARYVLFTDADIAHAPWSLSRLVAESEAAGLALNSRMALLRCRAWPERLLIPAFVFFFNLLYPMRRVNDPRSRVAAAAGGCVLLRTDALRAIGGLAAIRSEIIDDVNLAARVKPLGAPIRLATSRADVVSVRAYETVGSIWRMVRRTAFDELDYSWLRLAGTVAGMLVLFAGPPAALAAGLAWLVTADGPGATALTATGAAAWLAMSVAYAGAVRFFGLQPAWALLLPIVGVLYGAMTADSARISAGGGRGRW